MKSLLWYSDLCLTSIANPATDKLIRRFSGRSAETTNKERGRLMDKHQKLVDRGFDLASQIKEMESELDEIKKTLKQHAKEKKLQEIVGRKAVAKFSPQSYTSCDPKTLHKKMEELAMGHLFFDYVKVQITKAKAALGETVFSTVSKSGSTPFAKVTFKKQ